jgi:hypothetical protein
MPGPLSIPLSQSDATPKDNDKKEQAALSLGSPRKTLVAAGAPYRPSRFRGDFQSESVMPIALCEEIKPIGQKVAFGAAGKLRRPKGDALRRRKSRLGGMRPR